MPRSFDSHSSDDSRFTQATPNRGEYSNAADELLRWVKAKGGVTLQGSVKRRATERSLFLC
ncbi:glycoside hydrolase family protein [Rickettsia endosymbiont of Gonocerus acuteangulatus]|uniref:glycoside hydrolase family protein n=1 Tax=Rickettsia endosymbiont of Gonocerus acuteangulatus TaxID=3066266 RepID=UPI00397B8DE5